jgi:tRNA (guanine37-N1)-methyltransferase
LLSGHHARIAEWRRSQSLLLTAAERPDLITLARQQGLLCPEDERVLSAGYNLGL